MALAKIFGSGVHLQHFLSRYTLAVLAQRLQKVNDLPQPFCCIALEPIPVIIPDFRVHRTCSSQGHLGVSFFVHLHTQVTHCSVIQVRCPNAEQVVTIGYSQDRRDDAAATFLEATAVEETGGLVPSGLVPLW